MSHYPSVRHKKIKEKLFKRNNNMVEDNAYWQGYLNDRDINCLCGYDFAYENVENRVEEIELAFEDYVEDVREYVHDVLDVEIDLGEKHVKKLASMFKEILQQEILNFLEDERDILVTTMIDDMNEEEYDKIKESVDSGKRQHKYTIQKRY